MAYSRGFSTGDSASARALAADYDAATPLALPVARQSEVSSNADRSALRQLIQQRHLEPIRFAG